MRPLVLDTNVVLDLLVFRDPRTFALRDALQAWSLRWIATTAMREELQCVLAYPNFLKREPEAQEVIAAFEAHADVVAAPDGVAPVKCRDTDDQKFIDLAVAHGALLLSKDKEVLRLARKLAPFGVETRQALPA